MYYHVSSFLGLLVSFRNFKYSKHNVSVLICLGQEGSSIVAVKTLKESAGDKERQDLLKELQVMKSLKPHPNIVTLFGCCTDKGQLLFLNFTYKRFFISY